MDKTKAKTYVRRRGVLLPVFSLPSRFGIGAFGAEAIKFIDTLSENGASIWAILPTGVTGYGDSPYQSFSSFALNPYFLDLEELMQEGLLTEQECSLCDMGSDPGRVDYGKLYENRVPLLMTAFARAIEREGTEEAIEAFEAASPWLNDYAEFMAIKNSLGGVPWYEWEPGLRDREESAMERMREKLSLEIRFQKYLQMKLMEQWARLQEHALRKAVLIMGDLPIYCAYDSADCWAYRRNFRIDKAGKPKEAAGVPPDYFCEDGQLWGNPTYDWYRMKKDGFSFWLSRLRRAAELYDILRIDHFRGFASYYAVPAGAPNAREGVWRKAEGGKLFEAAAAEGLSCEIIAEDLGFITRDVVRLLNKTGFAGMQVMEFAFDDDKKNPHKNRRWNGDPLSLRNKIAYTGTHDNPPLAAWWEETDEHTRLLAEKYAGTKELPRGIIDATVACDARYAIVPAQDLLLLGAEARMNTPATAAGNWTWRLTPKQAEELKERIKATFNKGE